jgi:hypothetical protein
MAPVAARIGRSFNQPVTKLTTDGNTRGVSWRDSDPRTISSPRLGPRRHFGAAKWLDRLDLKLEQASPELSSQLSKLSVVSIWTARHGKRQSLSASAHAFLPPILPVPAQAS